MIDPKQIPDEVVEALHDSLVEEGGAVVPACYCRAALAAALNAWETPMHRAIVGTALDEVGSMYPALILPLPREGE
jgi:hypothetical protein